MTSQGVVVVLWLAFLCLILHSHTVVGNTWPLSYGLSNGLSYEMCKQAHVFISNCNARVEVVVSSWGAPTPIGTSFSTYKLSSTLLLGKLGGAVKPCSQYSSFTNAAEAWQQGYDSIHFLARWQLSPLLGWLWRSTGKATMQVNLLHPGI